MVFYMIGHSNHAWDNFQSLLTQHEIAMLIDVRSSARSRYPHFNGNRLRDHLSPIVYQHWPALGGKEPLPTSRLKLELATLLQSNSRNERMCLMCSEGDYRDCHRHHLLTPLVIELGWDVLQLGRDGSLTEDFGPVKTRRNVQAFLPL